MSSIPVALSLLTIAAGVCVSASAAGAATDPRVEAFRSACIEDRQDFEALKHRALTEGWAPVHAGVNAELDAMMERAAEAEFDPGTTALLESYLKAVAGNDAFLVLTSLASPQVDIVGCYVYDFEATAPIPPSVISDWLGVPPSDTIDEPEIIIGYTWETPEQLPGTWDIYLAYLPEGGGASHIAGFSGVLIKITSVDPKEE
ncbi:MAG: hypothetical protein KDJ88_03030 [Bauldia sp.]|nr:hypothetical protein [Bauldia sp.]